MKIIKQPTCETVFPYIAYIPETVGDHPALILQLHGAGERGNGGADLELVNVHGYSKIVNDSNLKDCILVMPQCPVDTFWAAKVESIKRFIDEIVLKFAIDTSRIYLCGISMGGFGTWYTAMAYPNIFAAILPCCGGGMAWNAEVLKMPVWAFHGLADDVVLPNHTIEMVERLKICNPNLKYSLYEGIGHDVWNQAFVEQTLQWLLDQKKAE